MSSISHTLSRSSTSPTRALTLADMHLSLRVQAHQLVPYVSVVCPQGGPPLLLELGIIHVLSFKNRPPAVIGQGPTQAPQQFCQVTFPSCWLLSRPLPCLGPLFAVEVGEPPGRDEETVAALIVAQEAGSAPSSAVEAGAPLDKKAGRP